MPLNIPSHLKVVVTLPYEILSLKNYNNRCIVTWTPYVIKTTKIWMNMNLIISICFVVSQHETKKTFEYEFYNFYIKT